MRAKSQHSSLCPGSWHHIQNLDSFFTKISFVLGMAVVVWEGPLGLKPFLVGALLRVGTCWGSEWEAHSGKAHYASGLFLNEHATSTTITRGMALPVSCWRMSSSWGETLVSTVPAASSPSIASSNSPGTQLCWEEESHHPGGWAGAHSALRPDPYIPCLPRQFVFIVTFTTFLLCCVDYSVLFANQPNNRTRPGLPHSKVTLSDAILPSSQCAQR